MVKIIKLITIVFLTTDVNTLTEIAVKGMDTNIPNVTISHNKIPKDHLKENQEKVVFSISLRISDIDDFSFTDLTSEVEGECNLMRNYRANDI